MSRAIAGDGTVREPVPPPRFLDQRSLPCVEARPNSRWPSNWIRPPTKTLPSGLWTTATPEWMMLPDPPASTRCHACAGLPNAKGTAATNEATNDRPSVLSERAADIEASHRRRATTTRDHDRRLSLAIRNLLAPDG